MGKIQVSDYLTEFGADYDVPAEVQAAVADGRLFDLSWHNDACPSFGISDEDNNFLILWTDHPDATKREVDRKRFSISTAEDAAMWEGEDINEGLWFFREEAGRRFPAYDFSAWPLTDADKLRAISDLVRGVNVEACEDCAPGAALLAIRKVLGL